MNPLVSVIIPAYNAEKFVAETVDSVLSQSYQPLELIVVDDGSTDKTPEVLKSFNGQIKYIYQKNQGQGKARNTGFQASSGEYIIFLDNDDILFPEMIKRGIEALTANPEYKAVYGKGYYFHDGEKEVVECPYFPKQTGSIFERVIEGVPLFQGQYILRRLCIEEAVGFIDGVGEDWQFQIRITKKINFLFVPYPFVKKRNHGQMHTLKKEKGGIIQRRLAYIEEAFGSEVEEIKRKYINQKVLANWHYECNKDIWKSISIYPWQPKLYLKLLKKCLGQ